MTAPTRPTSTIGTAPWVLAHATACAEAVATALDLLDEDDVETVPDDAGEGFTLRVHADPPRAVRAVRWSAVEGWAATADPALRRAPRWRALPLATDAEPLALCEVLRRRR
ncbi:hypothetical protein [Actinomycetospora straminea]|uniref:Uncharacterized protein n=1 Tax=Actinomycetospora straminea TaxID=663607 RepID=A0ABP9FA27_9PSEU|nr:hypothetical protein [Actinomycetospora straminea]MDD7933055.1 hypothetical protein [Actinomycetospora straminea]